MKAKINKYYRDAYNNPMQYAENFTNRIITDKNKEMINQIGKGISDAQADKQKGIYNFKN